MCSSSTLQTIGLIGVWLLPLGQLAGAESLSVKLKSGKQLRGQLDTRTDGDQLWLRFGTDRTSIVRHVPWEDVESVARRTQTFSFDALRQLARETVSETQKPAASSDATRAGGMAQIIPRDIAATGDRSPSFRVQNVRFDAYLSNWDAGVETDGLVVQIWPQDGNGNHVSVRGILHAELWAMRRTPQAAAPSSRGRLVEQVSSWTIPVPAVSSSTEPVWVQLPFQARHPEFDVNWSPVGLLQVTLVVPGHGVFHYSQDGLRIRPFAPLRDYLERETGARFLHTEHTDRK